MNNQKENKLPTAILIFIISVTPVNAVLYTPALPKLTEFLNISKTQAQHTIAYFLIGYALSQIVFGGLANYLGRKKALLVGLTLGVAASFLSIFACFIKNYDILLYSRFLVGFGTAAGLIITYAMVNDKYSGVMARKVMSYIIMSFAVAPGIANLAGGFLTEFNPSYCFVFLFIYNLAVLIVVKKYLHCEVEQTNDFNLINYSKEYLTAFVDKKIVLPALIYGLFAAMLYSILAILPFIVIQTFHYPPELFGVLLFLSYLGYLSGSLTVTSISHKFTPHQAMLTGIIIAIICEIVLFISAVLNIVNGWLLFTCIFFILFSLPFIFVNASVLGLSNHKNKSTASSVLNFINVTIACIAVFICGFVKENFLISLSLVLLVMSLLALVLLTVCFVSKIKFVSLNPIKIVVRD